MCSKFIKQFLWWRRRNEIRNCIRGYSKLRKENQIGLLRDVLTSLSCSSIFSGDDSASKLIYGESYPQAERLTRQYLLQINTTHRIVRAILNSLGRHSKGVVYPIPTIWLDVLVKHGIAVDYRRSAFVWRWMVFLYLAYGIWVIAKLTASSLFASLKSGGTFSASRYAYLQGLTRSNLPQPTLSGDSHDIFTWYSRWEGRASNLEALCHGVKDCRETKLNAIRVEYIDDPFNLNRDFIGVFRFLGWGLAATGISVIDALRGRWWHALVLAEAAKAKAVQMCAPELLAVDYLFPYSASAYRPMWTYEAEKKGARIVCYFYSTYEQVKLPDGYESQKYEWGTASWPLYLVWDQYQADLLRRNIEGAAEIKVVGPILFSTSSVELPEIPERSIAVFDVQPHRLPVYFPYTTMAEYHDINKDMRIRFLQDIQQVLSENGASMVFKRKREIGGKGVKKYMSFVHELSQSKTMLSVDPGISPVRVIEKCQGIISMPFTSTALYLRDQGIPSVYYDPSGWLQRDDRGAHGIPIVSGIDELRNWVQDVLGP